MPEHSPFAIATGHHRQTPRYWMPATAAEPLVLGDPVLIWLRYHGNKHGFQPDRGPHQFLDFIGEKGRQFEERWIQEMAPEAVRICADAYEVHSVDKARETVDLIERGSPVLVQPALWWAPEQLYGVPDVLVHTAWLQSHLPQLARGIGTHIGMIPMRGTGQPGYYVVLDMKFTSDLDGKQKKVLESYIAQVRIYSYMLGNLQGIMPPKGYLVTRDRIFDPIPVRISSALNEPLDDDLAVIRDRFLDIKLHGDRYLPWRDAIVESDLGHRGDRWLTAKQIIAREKVPGGDPGILFQVSSEAKRELARYGFHNLESLLRVDPQAIPLEECAGLGPAKAQQIRAILEANRSKAPVIPPARPSVPKKDFEFYVDFEYFTNVNVDFEKQWPSLDGYEMIFLIGVGWDEQGAWSFQTFVAPAEDLAGERQMLDEFLHFLGTKTDGAFTDARRTSIYHWSSAEAWQALRASDRHRLPASHPLQRLPWFDLQKEFLRGPIGLPGSWNYRLKDVSRAIHRLCPHLDLQWPGDLDQGLQAMVMGWKAYQAPNAAESPEMATIEQYLEADCRALWGILNWLRSWTD